MKSIFGRCAFGAVLAMALLTAQSAIAETPLVAIKSYDGTGSQDNSIIINFLSDKVGRQGDDKERNELVAAAKKGDSSAMLELAAIYEQGETGNDIDRPAAFDLYEKAANLGERVGREKMCAAYLLGGDRPVSISKGMAYCAKLGTKNATGLFSAAYDYERGVTGPKDDDAAAIFYVEAVKLGSGEAADALGVRASAQSKPEVARKWFREGVYLGSGSAMDHLAAMTEAGQGGPADAREAYWLYVNAARRGNLHAAEWVKALPPSVGPLNRVANDLRTPLLTRTYQDKKGVHSEPYDLKKLSGALMDVFPAEAMKGRIDGHATLHCYINSEHLVDTCILQRERPLGYGFGRIISALFNTHLTAATTDGRGRPTAYCVYVMSINWQP